MGIGEMMPAGESLHTPRETFACVQTALHLNINSLQHSKHTPTQLKDSRLPVYRHVIADYFDNSKRHTHTSCSQHVEFLNFTSRLQKS